VVSPCQKGLNRRFSELTESPQPIRVWGSHREFTVNHHNEQEDQRQHALEDMQGVQNEAGDVDSDSVSVPLLSHYRAGFEEGDSSSGSDKPSIEAHELLSEDASEDDIDLFGESDQAGDPDLFGEGVSDVSESDASEENYVEFEGEDEVLYASANSEVLDEAFDEDRHYEETEGLLLDSDREDFHYPDNEPSIVFSDEQDDQVLSGESLIADHGDDVPIGVSESLLDDSAPDKSRRMKIIAGAVAAMIASVGGIAMLSGHFGGTDDPAKRLEYVQALGGGDPVAGALVDAPASPSAGTQPVQAPSIAALLQNSNDAPAPVADAGDAGAAPAPVADAGATGDAPAPVADAGATGDAPAPVADAGATGAAPAPVADAGATGDAPAPVADAGATGAAPAPAPAPVADAGDAGAAPAQAQENLMALLKEPPGQAASSLKAAGTPSLKESLPAQDEALRAASASPQSPSATANVAAPPSLPAMPVSPFRQQDHSPIVAVVTPKPSLIADDPFHQPQRSGVVSGRASEAVKALTVVSPDQIGLELFAENHIMVNSKGTRMSFTVSDTLPNGEVIERIDLASMTLITDRSIIRIKN
jgi:hypothetical protein